MIGNSAACVASHSHTKNVGVVYQYVRATVESVTPVGRDRAMLQSGARAANGAW